MDMLGRASERSLGIQMGRLAETLGFEMVDGLPAGLARMEKPPCWSHRRGGQELAGQ
jgi:hypothetical protein